MDTLSPYQYNWPYDGPDDAPDETPNEWMEWYKPFHAAIQSGHVDGRGGLGTGPTNAGRVSDIPNSLNNASGSNGGRRAGDL